MSDPYLTLGVTPEADDATIHAAYLVALKACPPERDRIQFEAMRNAYESIRTHRARLAHALFDSSPPSITEILHRAAPLQAPKRPNFALFTSVLRRNI